ncbi:MAG: hypothetical protein COT88_02245 [Candidatus Colwellbacteria bacterium CG10_big_fil_rev_8_21_14_0_10_41_28]|uniref:DUF5667 domain-containing protein n=1 Tax=Candidatus Colwellbacteria bacterium CG10_big_fil_rev_8_21_14_0_10_41_28 TaxID=1974539 RepID=A0A2H0VGT0_9BACT|nr:MAG: hypothetical protein COT88_02245 [Candidatus Colwellbacteria bacterium CG10_big_fil_rev_8_21_14_0_10_41_28]
MIKNIFKLMMVAMVLLGPVSAYAQTPDLFNKLAVAEDLSEQERLVKKVSLTENALNQAVARVEKIETDLNALTFAENSKETTSRQAFLADMESHKNFYNQKLETLSQIGSLSDVNTLIQEIIDYRETVYSPATKSALEFLLVFSYSPTALETANNRLSKISEDLTKLTRLNLIEREEFSALISEAETKLTGAERLQAISRAKLLGEEFIEEIIENTTSTEEIIIEETLNETELMLDVTTSTEIIDSTPSIEELVPEESPELSLETLNALGPLDLAQMSLDLIKDVYSTFMEAGDRIKTILGIVDPIEEATEPEDAAQ